MSQAGQFYQKTLVSTLTGDIGGAVGPVAGNIDFIGSYGITVDGFPLVNRLIINSELVSSWFTTDVGTARPAAGIINILGGININSEGAGNSVTLNLDDVITLTTVNATTINATDVVATTFTTDNLAEGITINGNTISADGTDLIIDINIDAKGTGDVVINSLTATIFNTPYLDTITVAKSGGDYTTIQDAVTVAVDGDTILVFPGIYTETVTHVENNVTLIAQGKPTNCIITQADANVIDFATFNEIQYKGFGISCTAATTAIWTVEGTTGSCSFKECQLYMTTAADIAAVAQPGIGRVAGAGKLIVILGKAGYYHTGDGGATAQKAAFSVADGGLVDLQFIDDLVVSNSGTALGSAVGIDTASTGNFLVNDCHIEITDPNATIVVGLAYLGGTGIEHEYFRNEIHVNATNNIGYGFFSADTATTTRFFFNHIHVEDVAGTSHSYHVGAGATVISSLNDIVAADGPNIDAAGLLYQIDKPIRGDFICSGPTADGTRNLTVANTDNTATVSSSAVNISVGGATSTGDPYTNYLVTGAGTYSIGIDNSDSDNFKITTGATPSAGTDLFTMSDIGVITLNNDLDVTEGGTGVGTFTDHGILIGNTINDITATAEGSTGTILTGVTGDEPVWTTATYPATAAMGTILVASGANVITTLAPDTAGYVLIDGGAGVAPSRGTDISGITSITMADNGSIQTTTTDTDTMLIQGYDVDGTAYVPFITITNADDPTCDLNTGVTIGTKYIYRADGTDVPVADGGTGASSLTDHGVLVGSDTAAIDALAVGTDGQVLVGDSANDPVFASIASTDGSITITGGAGTLDIEGTAAGEAQVGVVELATDAEAIAGTASTVINCTSLKAKLGAQTSHGLPYGAATTGAIAWTAEPTDGQLLMGDTGAIPQLGTLTAGTGITVTNAAHSVTVASTGTTVKNETGTTYTFVLTDAGKHITLTNGAAIAATVPTNASVAFPIGTIISFSQGGAGQVTLSGATPPTLQSADSALTTVKIYSGGCMIKILTDTWRIFGDMEA